MTDGTEPGFNTNFGHAHERGDPATFPEPWLTIFGGAVERAKTNLVHPFTGITANGTVAADIFRHAKTGLSLAPVAAAARAFAAALSEAHRDTLTFDVDALEWRMWHNMHPNLMRHGVSLYELDDAQRELALALMRETFSAAGYENARGVMKLNEYVAEITGQTDEFGEWYYFLSFFGTPSESEPWGWQIDGHHLSVNCFILGDRMVLTPQFSGSEPLVAASGKHAGTRVFDAETEAGFALMSALTAEQRATATIGASVPRDVFAGAQLDNITLPYAGIRADALDEQQRALLLRAIAVYVGRMRPGHDAVRMDEVRAHFDATYFAWIGAFDDTSPFYYRIQSPVILIEFDHLPGIVYTNAEPSRRHVHTMVRTPNGNDYGRDLLAKHYAEHDHAHPDSPHRLTHG